MFSSSKALPNAEATYSIIFQNATPPLIPIGRSTWWQWVRDGKAPAPVKLGPRTTAWKSADILDLIDALNGTKVPRELPVSKS